jgi:hypothetical protein
VRNAPDGVRELAMRRWGMPGPPQYGGAAVTNVALAEAGEPVRGTMDVVLRVCRHQA